MSEMTAAEDARIVVIGSVSLHCVLHAHCPVLVLRDQPGQS